MDRTMAMASKYAYWNSDTEKQFALKRLGEAKKVYESMK
jgi:hypothetical protein